MKCLACRLDILLMIFGKTQFAFLAEYQYTQTYSSLQWTYLVLFSMHFLPLTNWLKTLEDWGNKIVLFVRQTKSLINKHKKNLSFSFLYKFIRFYLGSLTYKCYTLHFFDEFRHEEQLSRQEAVKQMKMRRSLLPYALLLKQCYKFLLEASGQQGIGYGGWLVGPIIGSALVIHFLFKAFMSAKYLLLLSHCCSKTRQFPVCRTFVSISKNWHFPYSVSFSDISENWHFPHFVSSLEQER